MGSGRQFLAILWICVVSGVASAEALAAPDAVTAVQVIGGKPQTSTVKWRQMLARIESERIRVEQCLFESPCRDVFAKPMANVVRRFSGLTGRPLLDAVNRYYNSFPYKADHAGGGPADEWSSPLSFLQRSGDCEDYAIAKYFTLRLLGVPDTNMAVLILRDRNDGLDHAVLMVEDGDHPLVLDNLRPISGLEMYRGYRPLLSLNADSEWQFEQPGMQATARPAGRR